jgi:hypothetical protein
MNFLKPSWFLFFSLVTCSNLIAQPPRLVLPIGHTEDVNNAQLSPDNKLILTYSAEGSVNFRLGSLVSLFYSLVI